MYLVQVPEGAMLELSAARLAGREDERAMRVRGLRDLLRWLQDDPGRQGESPGRGERVIIDAAGYVWKTSSWYFSRHASSDTLPAANTFTLNVGCSRSGTLTSGN
jgi:hypothetical protein